MLSAMRAVPAVSITVRVSYTVLWKIPRCENVCVLVKLMCSPFAYSDTSTECTLAYVVFSSICRFCHNNPWQPAKTLAKPSLYVLRPMSLT